MGETISFPAVRKAQESWDGPTLDPALPDSPVEGSHWNEGLLLGRPPEEPEQPLTENSLLEVLDGAVMMYNLSVHQQLGKVVHSWTPRWVGGGVRVWWCVCMPVCTWACRAAYARPCMGAHASVRLISAPAASV